MQRKLNLGDRRHESFLFGIEWNMRDRRPYLFLAAYFLVIFFWLLFCYRQVQKACHHAGHTLQSTVLEVSPVWRDEETGNKGIFERNETKKTEEKVSGEEPQEKELQDMELSAQEKEDTDAERIRVVLLGESGVNHKKILLEADGEKLEIAPDSPYFAKTDIIRISVAGTQEKTIQVLSLDRACGHPSYQGILEIRKEREGLVLVNEVSLEEYVKGVLPSEMPAAYPLEALKAQAVCARTYAKMRQENKAYPEYNAAVDDSTACQVYRNLDTAPEGDLAVEETGGEVLKTDDGSFVDCYYYSTSCGRGAQVSVWHGGETKRPVSGKSPEEIAEMNSNFFDYISHRYEEHAESEEAFYRWSYRCDKAADKTVFGRCADRRAINDKLVWAQSKEDGKDLEISGAALGNIRDMSVVERQEGGVADCVKITCEKGDVYVWGEYNIRYVLALGGEVRLQSGADYQAGDLLPSAFISLQSICNDKGNMVGYIVEGGGFGHGVGMSQNGAKHMALAGSGYKEILETYYSGRVF